MCRRPLVHRSSPHERLAPDGFLLAGRADHQELARTVSRNEPASLDLGSVAAQHALVRDGAEVTRAGALVGLEEGDRGALPAAQECGVQRLIQAAPAIARLMGRATYRTAGLDQRRDERHGRPSVHIGVETVPDAGQVLCAWTLCHPGCNHCLKYHNARRVLQPQPETPHIGRRMTPPRSAAIALKTFRHCERVPQPGWRKILQGDIVHWLEELEMVPRLADPEHHYGLQWRTARHAAGDFRDKDRRVCRKREALRSE